MEEVSASAPELDASTPTLKQRARAASLFALGVLAIIFRGLRRCFFSTLAVVAILAFFGIAPQGQEILSLALESAEWSRLWFVWLMIAAAGTAIVAWYTSRVLMDFHDLVDVKLRTKPLRDFAHDAERWIPRILGALCILPIVFFAANAGVTSYALNSPLLILATFAGIAAFDAWHHCVRRHLYAWGFWLCLVFAAIAHDWKGELPYDRVFSWRELGKALFRVEYESSGGRTVSAFGVETTGVQVLLAVALWVVMDRLCAWWLNPQTPRGRRGRLRQVALPIWLALAVLAVLLWLQSFDLYFLDRTPVALPCAVIVAVLVVSFFIHRRDWFARMWASDSSVRAVRGPRAGEEAARVQIAPVTKRLLLGSLALGVAVLILIGLAPIRVGQFLGTPALLLLAVSVWIVFGAVVLTVLPKAYGFPALGLIVLVVAGCNTVLQTPIMISTVPDRQERSTGAPVPRLGVREAFEEWSRNRKDLETGPIYVVAAAGGGIRAAFITASYLAAVDDLSAGRFGQRVFAISGVSGGSLGAATYARLVGPAYGDIPDAKCSRGADPDASKWLRQRVVLCALGADFLSPTIATFLFPDLLRSIWLPGVLHDYLGPDRGRTLESAWKRQVDVVRPAAFDGTFGEYVRSLHPAPGATRSPGVHLILNATRVQSGQRAIVSSLRWDAASAIDLLDDRGPEPLQTADLSFVGAVHNSARFTYVSPAGAYYAMSTDGPELAGQLADGGYFDNSGILSLLEVIAALPESARSRVHVIVITNDGKEATICQAPRTHDVSGAVQLIAPIATFLATRPARAELSKAQLAALLGPAPCSDARGPARVVEVSLNDDLVAEYLRHGNGDPAYNRCESATTRAPLTESEKQIAVRVREAPLGWTLSERTSDWLTRYARRQAWCLQRQLPAP